jgi:hypothetical protein
MVVPLLLSISLVIVSHRKVGKHIPAAFVISEHLSKEWHNRNIYAPQAKRELEHEIFRLKMIEREKLHPRRVGSIQAGAGGGTLHGALGEDLKQPRS